MTKNRKTLLMLVLAITLVFTLVACNNNSGNSSSSSSNDGTSISSNDGGSSSEDAGGSSSEAGGSSSEDGGSSSEDGGNSSDGSGDSSSGDPSTPDPELPAVDKSVTMNGTAYDTIALALAAIPTDSTETFTITLTRGTYEENGLQYNGSATIKIVGDTPTKYGADVIIVGHGSDMTTLKTRSLIAIQGTGNIILENLTLKSDWTRAVANAEGMASNTQAEVLGTDTTGNTVAYNCSFKSYQDTLRTAGKAWFYGCYIEGDVDFIWMEQAGTVALYEKCEIVSVYDSTASSHVSRVTAPRMAISTKAGKGLVIFNSTVKESAEAKENGQKTYLARTPWTSGYFSQVAYINTTCEDIEASIWEGSPIATEFAKTVIGWKMDQATATSLGYAGNDDILDADTVAKEFSGRKTILNRVYNTGKQKYEQDNLNLWDIDALIAENGWSVDADNSSSILDGEEVGETTIYLFDGSIDQSELCNGFAVESGKPHYRGGNDATITIPVSGKSYVEVYGYYSGTLEAKADTQGEAVMFFNNGSTSAEVLNTYAVYDENATSVVLTAKATTYITKIVVTTDSTIEYTATTSFEITSSSNLECVGVALTLSSKAIPTNATNKSVKWSSSDTTIADIDVYTGRVTFKNEGTVTFTATACDGSGATGTFTCNPINPKWTAIEWYTTDNDWVAEAGAQGIENFSYGASTNKKDIDKSYTFTNLAGQEITTAKGLKLDSKGELIIATTKSQATLTIIVGPHSTLVTPTPNVTDGTTVLTPVSEEVQADNTIVYVFDLAKAGTWRITRGGTSECSPIIYAKCEYETRIVKDTFVNYKGGAFSTPAGFNAYNHNNPDGGSKIETTDEVTLDNFTYTGAQSNGNDNWLKFNTGATIKFKVAGASSLNIYFYNGQNNVSVTLNGNEVTTATETQTTHAVPYVYALSGEGEVVITATANGYLGAFEVAFPKEAISAISVDTGLVFHGDSISGIDNVIKWADNTATGTQDNFTIAGSNYSNSGYLEFKNDDTISFDVSFDETQFDAVITISSYSDVASVVTLDGADQTVTKDEANSANQAFIYTATLSASGSVQIAATASQNYLNYLTITFVAKA